MYNKLVGDYGEKLAKNFLIKNNYKIIETNTQTSHKELDIIAIKNSILTFVEVKTRTNPIFQSADESVSKQKIKNLKQAISFYLNNLNKISYNDIRLDLIAININKPKKIAHIKHIKDIV